MITPTHPPRTAWARAMRSKRFTLIETFSGYRSSIADYRGAQHVLSPNADEISLGAALTDALAHSRFVLPQDDPELFDYGLCQTRYDQWLAGMISRFELKNKQQLLQDVMTCNIKKTGNEIRLMPTRHDKLEGWEGLAKEEVVSVMNDSTPETLGTALNLAFSRCK